MTIRFRHNPATGSRELVISYESDSDALPHEHERDHRALVEAVLGQGLGEGASAITVERVGKDGKVIDERREELPPTRTPTAQGQGG